MPNKKKAGANIEVLLARAGRRVADADNINISMQRNIVVLLLKQA